MTTHKEIRENKVSAVAEIAKVVKERAVPVNVVEMYAFFGDVWNTPAYFIQDVKRMIGNEFDVKSRKKAGTVITYTGKPETIVKKIVAGGLFPHNYEGRLCNVTELEGYTKLKQFPKMFNDLASETIELYRKDEIGRTSEYLQVTNRGTFQFVQVS